VKGEPSFPVACANQADTLVGSPESQMNVMIAVFAGGGFVVPVSLCYDLYLALVPAFEGPAII